MGKDSTYIATKPLVELIDEHTYRLRVLQDARRQILCYRNILRSVVKAAGPIEVSGFVGMLRHEAEQAAQDFPGLSIRFNKVVIKADDEEAP